MTPRTRLCWGVNVMPYGHLSWIIPTLTLLAMLFFLFPAFRCSLTVEKQPGNIEIWYGYWHLEDSQYAIALGAENDSNVCIKWGEGSGRAIFDGAWKFGKALGVIGSFTTIPVGIVNFYLFFGRISLTFFPLWIGLHILNAFLSFMLLIGLKSELCKSRDCKLARGGYIAIIGGLFWLLAAVLLCLARRVEQELSREPDYLDDDIDYDDKRLALPAPEESDKWLALPAPEESDDEYENEAPSTREVPLALPPSETAAQQLATKPTKKKKGTGKSNKKDTSPEASENMTPGTKPKKKKKKAAGSTTTSDNSAAR